MRKNHFNVIFLLHKHPFATHLPPVVALRDTNFKSGVAQRQSG